MKRLATAVTVMIVLSLALTAPAMAKKGKTYGKPLGGKDTVAVSELIANADDYVGQTVRIKGVVNAVCPKRGCWMTIASDEEFQELKIKVDDGVIVFPLEAKGKRAVAEGVFMRIEMSLEQTVAYLAHHAEEHGEEFDPASVKEPMTRYQIQATGAVVY
ncbi:MAG: DUF4920 domain-containing protein [bacterium]|nr:DUF4920 domain-containing protein [bacterium]